MFQDFWNSILELTSKFVIPDWGSVVAMLPVIIFVIGLIVIIILFWKLARAPEARRGKQRLEPIPPAGLHMPGPSWAPVFAAIGAFTLFLGLVFGGVLLIIGAIVLALTLVYWLREAVRIYDHDIGETAPQLPAVAHDGPPPGVHMPGPSFLPVLAAIGMFMLFLGLVFGGWLLLAGIIGLILTLAGWMTAARKEYVNTVEADRTGHLEPLPDPKTPKWLIVSLAIVFIVAFVVQIGWIPPAASGGEATASGAPSGAPAGSGGPPPSGGPGGSGAPPGGGGPVVHAKDVAYVDTSFTAPADAPFKLEFVNEDNGIPHNIDIHDSSGASVFKGEIFPGVATKTYDVPALRAGSYPFVCSVHPTMTGTATIR
jgi:Cupredoxin-like domain